MHDEPEDEAIVSRHRATGEGLSHLGDAQSRIRWGKLALEVLDPDESVLAAIPCIDAFEPSRALVVTDRRVIIRGVRVLRPRHTVRGTPRHHVTGARVEDGWLADGTILRTSTERGLL